MLRPVADRRRLPCLAACLRSGSAEGKRLGLKRPPAGLREAPVSSPCCAGARHRHRAVASPRVGWLPGGLSLSPLVFR